MKRPGAMNWLDHIPLLLLVFACFTLGLAPFLPEPHLWEKLRMLVTGTLVRPIDWLDLAMHASPWVLLALKLWREFGSTGGRGT